MVTPDLPAGSLIDTPIAVPPSPADRLDALIESFARHGHGIIPDFLPAPITATLLGELQQLFDAGQARPAGIGQGREHRILADVRNDEILWLDPLQPTPAQSVYWQAMEDLRLRLNREYYLGLTDYECHFARYQPGGFYKRHVDAFRGKSRRRVSCVLYMNYAWATVDGGQLRLYLPQGEAETTLDITPLAGTLAVFDSQHTEHEVLPAQRTRFSLTGWFRTR
jgi:SM-20-related protein